MTQITIKNLKKTYGNTEVIKGIDLEIKSGEFMVFVGPSGCGKSTMLRLICGLEDISSGAMYFDDDLVNDKRPADRGVAMVFQSYALYPHMSVYKNMAFGMKLAKATREETEARIKKVSEMLQIDHLLDRLPKQLSGGQRQRVAIGRAIVRDPQVFLFDEPLSNLDAALRVDTRLEIAKLHQEMENTTMIYVTHDQVEAMTLAERICVLRDGVVEQVGTPDELYSSPNSIFVAGFIGSPKMNFLQGDRASMFDCHTLGIRSEHIDLVESDGLWSGKIVHSENLGSDFYIFVDIGNDTLIVRLDGNHRIELGTKVQLKPMSEHLHRFDNSGQPKR